MDSPIKANNEFSQNINTLAKASNKNENPPMGQQVKDLAAQKKTEKAENTQQSISTVNKKKLNASILESALEFNKTIADQPQSLLLKTALQGINEALKAMGVENSVEETYDSAIDFSPEATAERIVSFSTQFLGSYREQHPEMDEEQSLNAFVDVISQGIDQGFSEARDLLGNMDVLEGDIAKDIANTYQFVQDGLQDFISRHLDKGKDETSDLSE